MFYNKQKKDGYTRNLLFTLNATLKLRLQNTQSQSEQLKNKRI